MILTTDPERGRAAERTAWAFYAIAAIGSIIGQIWVGVTVPPWPAAIDWWWRALLVAPFAAVIDLGGVVTSAFADTRRRRGETAYGWRILSIGSVTTGVCINLIGHGDVPYLAAVFGGLGVFAYTVWLLHAADRRRDALRAAGKLADTAPSYSRAQRRREPEVTRRAELLAVEHGYSLHESLVVARHQLRDERRRAALATHVETLIRARHEDPVRAAIAATTLDIDAIAVELTAHSDVAGWATAIGADLRPPQPPAAGTTDSDGDAPDIGGVPMPPTDVLRRVPTSQDAYDRWRDLWAELSTDPDVDLSAFADRHDISVRQAQWIRSVGATGLLNSPIPPAVRLARLATINGHRPHDDSPAS
ncbi:hypothetical protein [Micromonospora sp. WMMD1082]|uniref:hypothetical protein n=1 Tax=Micromonospora sp. WMMD1082 TaxID=3016104 RepID=UPI002416B836|nr:hypothetical protein [Micromonospora sp. WMMD1082]MDG4795414.1 hypothetical protein [Micromonospora sp. WMMD1082]